MIHFQTLFLVFCCICFFFKLLLMVISLARSLIFFSHWFFTHESCLKVLYVDVKHVNVIGSSNSDSYLVVLVQLSFNSHEDFLSVRCDLYSLWNTAKYFSWDRKFTFANTVCLNYKHGHRKRHLEIGLTDDYMSRATNMLHQGSPEFCPFYLFYHSPESRATWFMQCELARRFLWAGK